MTTIFMTVSLRKLGATVQAQLTKMNGSFENCKSSWSENFFVFGNTAKEN